MALLDDIRRYWNDDAATYDDAPDHRPRRPMVQAAWSAALEDVLPPAPARVLDCGAGTGFLSLIAARLGHQVTALDLSPVMLGRLRAKAEAEGLAIDTAVGSATDPPPASGDDGPPGGGRVDVPAGGSPAGGGRDGGRDGAAPGRGPGRYDVVVERHLLWTLPDPAAALRAWREAVRDGGRLVLVESLWGRVDPYEQRRSEARRLLHRLRRLPPAHHAHYGDDLRAQLPLGSGTHPDRLVEMVTAAGWRARLRRLRDVEWAERAALAGPERLVGVTPRFTLVAD